MNVTLDVGERELNVWTKDEKSRLLTVLEDPDQFRVLVHGEPSTSVIIIKKPQPKKPL